MKKNLLSSVLLTVISIIFLCGVYTLSVFGIAQFAPNNGKGEIIEFDGEKYYSNIGQRFTEDRYFWSRPSYVDFDASKSGGSNKGASNPEYLVQVEDRIELFLKHNPGVLRSDIPVELVTASGSGLDPNISVKGAEVQIKRIASVRGISEAVLKKLVTENTEKPFLSIFGPERINVLKLNIALDNLNR